MADHKPRVIRPKRLGLRRYFAARRELPLLVRGYLFFTDLLRIDPDTCAALPEVQETTALEGTLVHLTPAPAVCPAGPIGCLCRSKGGKRSCLSLNRWAASVCPTASIGAGCVCHRSKGKCYGRYRRALRRLPVGTFSIADFAGSPQQHAILNRHLLDYFRDRNRALETTPYAIPASQAHLLQDLGMEEPQPDAPVVPHALHKSIEEFQLSRMRNYLAPGGYNLICAKDAKVHKLPTPASRQNPLRQSKDVSRFPGSALVDADFSASTTHFMHDVAAEVTPHELVEKLVDENPEAHLFVTGLLPAEVIDRVESFEPASHYIKYEGSEYSYVFAGSVSESYCTPIDVTLAWLHTNSVVASNGRVYHVTLLDDKLGHCLYHIFCGDVEAQASRFFSTGSLVRLPPALTGTLRAEYVPAKLLTAALDFVRRTPDLSTRNLSAKVTMVANVTNPKTTSRERWVVWHIMSLLAPYHTTGYYLRALFWKVVYAVTLQWQMFAPVPDVYRYLEERERFLVVHPTEGGGWSRRVKFSPRLHSIPNNPTMLQRVTAFTAFSFVFVLPKVMLSEVLTGFFLHVNPFDVARTLWRWLDLHPARALLTGAVLVVASVLPTYVVQYLSSLSSHYWRQLWWPGYVRELFHLIVMEVTGAPGHVLAASCPGRGWAWQALIWAIALHTVLPGLVPALVVPWVAYTHGWHLLMTCWLGCVVVENLAAARDRPLFQIGHTPWVSRHTRTPHALRQLPARVRFGLGSRVSSIHRPVSFFNLTANIVLGAALNLIPTLVPAGPGERVGTAAWSDICDVAHIASWCLKWAVNTVHRAAYVSQLRLGNCGRVPTLAPLPEKTKPVIRSRNVDRVLPTVVVQPNVPVAPVGAQLAIPPDGLSFPDWLQQVEAAYRQQPALHPLLTPGQDCFWQCVASLGGTPHLWFSWYMEFMRRAVPANQAVVGRVNIVDMHMFSAVSGIGLRLTGVTEEVSQPRDGRPSLNIRITHVPMSNDLHAELATTPVASDRVQSLACILATLRALYPASERAFVAAHQAAPVDSVAVPTQTLRAIAGAHELPTTMQEVTDGLFASFTATPFTAANPNGYNLDLVNGPPAPLYDYKSPVRGLQVARTPPDIMWGNFRRKPRAPLPIRRTPVGATPRQERDNVTRNNVRPEPPAWVTLMNELRAKVSDYLVGELPAVPLKEEVVQYTADVARASRLVSDLKAHPAVLGGKADARWLQSLDSILDLYKLENRSVTVPVRAYLGVGGCGKTTATIAYLKTLDPGVRQLARVVSHTESLRAQAKQSVDFAEMRGVNFPTIPGLISEPSAGPIIFDDAGKFFGGVLDLVLLTNPLVPEVVVNGDPAQALAKFPVGGTQSEFDKGPMVVAEQTTEYATISHRWFTLLAQIFGMHTTNPTRGHLTHTVGSKAGLPVTTASPRYVQVLASAGRQAYTHDTVQGEDFSTDVEFDMTALEDAISDRTAYVALSRSKTGVYLHMNAANPGSVIKSPPTGSDLLNAILYSMRADNLPTLLRGNDLTRAVFYAHLHACMPNLKWFAQVGATVPAGMYQSVVAASNTHLVNDATVMEPRPLEAPECSSAPIDTFVHETHWADKESRELGRAGIQTDQFKETTFVNPHVHKRQDHATYKLTVEKRINNATPAANYTRKKRCPRTDMIEEFDRLCPEVPRWTPEKHAHYMDRARLEYESGRTEAAVMAKLAAHDPERTNKDVLNSLKVQVINKDEKRSKFEAIPGQLIYEYDLSATMEDAAYALFLEDELFQAFPRNFLFYRRLSPDQFIRAYQERWRVNNGVHSSDVTRWDVGCDAGVLNFDEHLMRRVGFPAPYVADYVSRRLETRTQHGTLRTSQPSGDRYTWTLNTMRRAVVSSLVLGVTPADTLAINGDDAAMDRVAVSKPFPDSPWEFKDLNGPTGDFSGFELGGERPIYSARGIHYRTMVLVSRDPSAQEKWTNYLGLLGYANLDTPEAADVARLAETHMHPELFSRFLPAPLRPLFPHLAFTEQ